MRFSIVSILCASFFTATIVQAAETPFADKIGGIVKSYNRASDKIATGGNISLSRLNRLKDIGFQTIIDFRLAREGAGQEAQAAKRAGFNYIHIPIDKGAPSQEAVTAFMKAMKDPKRGTVLLHCNTGSRTGMMYAIYLAKEGVPVQLAIDAGKAAGMLDSQAASVRKRAGKRRGLLN
ncbi:fused DSP-PTPase phosphatase/NAD kinase-like protein [Algicola sagamiensis]|uniref:fused DSP-PTPase phosphatase/NAD kinase-like protein n=1 Tax=Algicola sagamiensis TaxID=163869 RepID=UPI00037FC565|nr:protein tyrosine phosphatase family protein [Algicola sagamiensis]